MSQNFQPQPPYPASYYTPAPPPKRRIGRFVFGWVLVIGLAIMLFLILQQTQNPRQNIPLSEFRAQLQKANISEIAIDGDSLTGTMGASGGGTTAFRTDLPPGTAGNWAFVSWLLENSGTAKVSVSNSSNLLSNILVPLIPWLLIFGFIWFFVFRNLRRAAIQNQIARPVFIVAPPGEAQQPNYPTANLSSLPPSEVK